LDERVDLVREHREEFGLNACLRAMGVSKGTWHYREERRRRGPDPEEEALRADVVDIIQDNPAYGRRRIKCELRARTGKVVNHKRLGRLLREWDLALKREISRTEPSGIRKALAKGGGQLNLLKDRDPAPLEALVTDFTELRYAGGARKAYLIAFQDPASAWVPGWAVGPSPNRELALTAWQRVQTSFRTVDRPLAGVVVHQDQDPVFTSYDWLRALLLDAEVLVSYSENGAKGNPWIESLWARFKVENTSLITETERMPELREVLGDQVAYYNRERRHSSLDYVSPLEFLRAEGMVADGLTSN